MGLFGNEKGQHVEGAFDTIIGEKAKFKGELNSAGSVSILGEFEGKIDCRGEVIISRGSKVTGDVHGGSVLVSGKVNGNISAAHNLEITKDGRVHGDLVGGKIIIEEGSSYRGKVNVESSASTTVEDEKKTEPVHIEEQIVVDETKSEMPISDEPQTHMFQNV